MYLSPRRTLSRLRAGLRRRRARVGVGCMSTTFPSIERRSRHPAALEEDGSSVAEDETVRGDRRSTSRRAVLCAKSLRRNAEVTWNTHCSPFPAHVRIVGRRCRPPHPCASRRRSTRAARPVNSGRCTRRRGRPRSADDGLAAGDLRRVGSAFPASRRAPAGRDAGSPRQPVPTCRVSPSRSGCGRKRLPLEAGAVVYARKRPDPVSAVFGYHAVFHVPGDRRGSAAVRGQSRSSCCPASASDRTRAAGAC
jgi:hypothetical protein